jgi:hypothetical protein
MAVGDGYYSSLEYQFVARETIFSGFPTIRGLMREINNN